ncbi:MAG: PKD domain-containing protein [Methanoregula sp.]
MIIALLFVGSVNAITANFNGAPRSGTEPLPVSFTDSSTGGPTGWAWYFGDENWQTIGSNWTEMTASPGWNDSYYSAATALPDGSIVMLGGFDNVLDVTLNDTWRSTDEGATWTLVNPSSGWLPRYAFPAVTLPDGSIVIMGGVGNYSAGTFLNDTWRSTDEGATWTEMNASSGWSPREYAAAVALPDGNITILGGSANGVYLGDVWQSTDKGATWTKINASAFGGTGLSAPAAVALQDGNIVVMGGYSGGHGRTSKTYRSTDEGKTWTVVNGSGGWQGRDRFPAVPLPDGSIVFASGYSGAAALNDTWRSANEGATWTELNVSAPWQARNGADMVSLPDGSVVILSGQSATNVGFDDVWRMQTASAFGENPVHIYTTPSNSFNVTLNAYILGNILDENSTTKFFFINPVSYPGFTSVIPSRGSVSIPNTVLIQGGGFNSTGTTQVILSRSDGPSSITLSTPANVSVLSNSLIRATIPSGIATGLWNVSVISPLGYPAANASVTYMAAISLTGINAINGTPQVGSTLKNGTVAPSGSTAIFQWTESSSINGPYTNISGATLGTYVLQPSDLGMYVEVNATGTGLYIETVNSTPVGPVIPLAPVSSFTENTTSGTVPLAVQFNDTSSNTPTSWYWVFGDGSTSTVQNATHTFSTSGTYQINLTASNAGGSNTSSNQTITVTQPGPTTTITQSSGGRPSYGGDGGSNSPAGNTGPQNPNPAGNTQNQNTGSGTSNTGNGRGTEQLGPLEPAGGPATGVNPSSPQLQNPIIITIANALLTLKENQFLLITGVVGIISVAVLRRWWIRRQQP